MIQLNFQQVQILLGRKGVTILNENHQTIDSWVTFFTSQRYYTDKNNLDILNRKNA